MKSDAQIAELVQKLLALAVNNPNRAEAAAAYQKAQDLMAKYGMRINVTKDGAPFEQPPPPPPPPPPPTPTPAPPPSDRTSLKGWLAILGIPAALIIAFFSHALTPKEPQASQAPKEPQVPQTDQDFTPAELKAELKRRQAQLSEAQPDTTTNYDAMSLEDLQKLSKQLHQQLDDLSKPPSQGKDQPKELCLTTAKKYAEQQAARLGFSTTQAIVTYSVHYEPEETGCYLKRAETRYQKSGGENVWSEVSTYLWELKANQWGDYLVPVAKLASH